jgi:hypothetical protein
VAPKGASGSGNAFYSLAFSANCSGRSRLPAFKRLRTQNTNQNAKGYNMTDSQELDRIDQLRQFRDELRLKMHLAKAEARDEWEKAETKWEKLRGELPKLDESADDLIDSLSEGTKRLAQDIRQAYRKIRDAD